MATVLQCYGMATVEFTAKNSAVPTLSYRQIIQPITLAIFTSVEDSKVCIPIESIKSTNIRSIRSLFYHLCNP